MVSPKKSRNNMFALFIGILFPLTFIISINYFNKIVDKNNIEKNTTTPVLGTIGHNMSDSDFSVFENPKSSLAVSFRAFRTNLQYLSMDQKCKIISISSVLIGEGKTFSDINLSSIIACRIKRHSWLDLTSVNLKYTGSII